MSVDNMSRRHTRQSDVWALTSYYNPIKYKTRLDNFRRFRRHLAVPLIVAELGFEDHWDLLDSDADVVIRVSGGSVLWQKERLLNVALARLPRHVSHVAWLDGDVVIDNSKWPEDGIRALRHVRLLQLFSHLVDLPRENQTLDFARGLEPSGTAVGHLIATGGRLSEGLRPASTLQVRQTCFGLAWMAARATLEAHGFYDAMIMGSGDRALVCAAIGRYEEAIAMMRLNAARRAHYLSWATAFRSAIDGSVAALPGKLFHFWHGELMNRAYADRHKAFASLDFDPNTDLELSPSGAWRWRVGREDLQQFAGAYFRSRDEDGTNK